VVAIFAVEAVASDTSLMTHSALGALSEKEQMVVPPLQCRTFIALLWTDVDRRISESDDEASGLYQNANMVWCIPWFVTL
jgi:hypothetical protein